MKVIKILKGSIFFLLICCYQTDAGALPFNQDMVGTQYGYGSVMRPFPKNSVPKGAQKRAFTRDEAGLFVNPVNSNEESLVNGSRLYNANCSSCHGRYIDDRYIKGVIYKNSLFGDYPVPKLHEKRLLSQKEGYFFQVIHFGKGLMPRYGFKLSIEEHWDIINYLRTLQNKTIR